MNQEEVESQLSAMFDGELPAAECELLSRRIDRDERLRARWSRYALVGAAMRSEPVATAPSGFAARVSAALDADQSPARVDVRQRSHGSQRLLGNAAVAASLIAMVAGVSIALLRNSQLETSTPKPVANVPAVESMPAVAAQAARTADIDIVARGGDNASGAAREPLSYVTPADHGADATALRTELADYIVAHSEYSTPLMRRNLLSALVSSGDDAGASDLTSIAGAPRAAAGGADATSPSQYSQR